MTEQIPCSCGANETKRIIFPCAGQANTGQLTNLAALRLTEEGFGSIACVALLAIGAGGLISNVRNADEVVILDGCPMQCGKKIAETQDVIPDQSLVVTELGIVKGPSKSYANDDIETIVSATWKGQGRKNAGKTSKKNAGPDSGCGCGCGDSC